MTFDSCSGSTTSEDEAALFAVYRQTNFKGDRALSYLIPVPL